MTLAQPARAAHSTIGYWNHRPAPAVKAGEAVGHIAADREANEGAGGTKVKVTQIWGAFSTASEAERAAKELSRWNGGQQVAVIAQRVGLGWDYTVATLSQQLNDRNFDDYRDDGGTSVQVTNVYSHGGRVNYDLPDSAQSPIWRTHEWPERPVTPWNDPRLPYVRPVPPPPPFVQPLSPYDCHPSGLNDAVGQAASAVENRTGYPVYAEGASGSTG